MYKNVQIHLMSNLNLIFLLIYFGVKYKDRVCKVRRKLKNMFYLFVHSKLPKLYLNTCPKATCYPMAVLVSCPVLINKLSCCNLKTSLP